MFDTSSEIDPLLVDFIATNRCVMKNLLKRKIEHVVHVIYLLNMLINYFMSYMIKKKSLTSVYHWQQQIPQHQHCVINVTNL